MKKLRYHKQEKKKIDFDKNKLELLKKSKRYNAFL